MLYFDSAFESAPHLKVMKEVLTQVFVTPKGHRKSKPFLDHVICFYWCAGVRGNQTRLAMGTLKGVAYTSSRASPYAPSLSIPRAGSISACGSATTRLCGPRGRARTLQS